MKSKNEQQLPGTACRAPTEAEAQPVGRARLFGLMREIAAGTHVAEVERTRAVSTGQTVREYLVARKAASPQTAPPGTAARTAGIERAHADP